MKSYTDLEQSKKLAEILPIESADMWYSGEDGDYIECGFGDVQQELYTDYGDGHPCWSLAALLDVFPSSTLDSSDDHYFRLSCNKRTTEWYDNAVDACYEMILKLNEQELL